MPRKDIYHNQLRNALQKDGWQITHDPMRFRWKGKNFFPDLGAERVLAAQKGKEKIAVELKSFLENAQMNDFYEAIGQFDIYRAAIADLDKERVVVLAIPKQAHIRFFSSDFACAIIHQKSIPLLVFDPNKEIVISWLK